MRMKTSIIIMMMIVNKAKKASDNLNLLTLFFAVCI
jgi:hypothetical protein